MKVKHRPTIGFVSMTLAIGLLITSCGSNELSWSDSAAGLNGSFEVTNSGYPVNWAFFPNPETNDAFHVFVDTSQAVDGEQSVKLITTAGGNGPGLRSQRVRIQAGETYRIGFSVKLNGCSVSVRRVVQNRLGVTNMRSDIIAEASPSTDEWQRFEAILSVRDGEANVFLIFLIVGSGTMWCDDVRIEEIVQ